MKKTENYKLSLRKKRLSDYIFYKRNLKKKDDLIQNSIYNINFDCINLPISQKEKKYLNAENFFQDMFLYLKSENYEEVKFSLISLKEFFSNDKINIDENINIIDNILECMKKYINDKIILYQGLWILVNYSFYSNKNECFTSANSFCLFEYIISMNDIELFCLILWLFHNITTYENKENNDLNYVIITSNIFKNKILRLLDKEELINHINDENSVYKDIILKGFNLFLNLIKCERQNLDDVEKLEIKQIKQQMIKIELKFIDTNIEIIYNIILENIISYFDFFDDSFPSKIISVNLIEKILLEKKFISNSSTLILKNRVIGNFLSVNDITDLNLIDNIFNFEYSILSNTKISEEKIDVYWTLGNLISCSDSISDLLIQKKEFIELIIKDFREDSNKIEIRELLITLEKIIVNANFNNFVILAQIGTFDELIGGLLRFEKDENLLVYIFLNISFFIEKGDIIKKYTDNTNIVLNKFNEKGGKDLLMKYQNCKCENLKNVVEKIWNRFYLNEDFISNIEME